MSEAKLSAIVISLLTGAGLTLALNAGFRDLGFVLSITVPVTLVMAAVLALFASDNIKKGGKEPPKTNSSEGN